jgi:hypothetical protein
MTLLHAARLVFVILLVLFAAVFVAAAARKGSEP